MSQASLSVYQGETLAFELEYTGTDGNPVPNLDGAEVELRLSSGQGPVFGTVDDTTGVLAFEVEPFITEEWPTAGLKFQVWLRYTSGKTEMVVDGQIDVEKAL
jgi:hypothetical protein